MLLIDHMVTHRTKPNEYFSPLFRLLFLLFHLPKLGSCSMRQLPALEKEQQEWAASNEDEQDLQQLAIRSASQPAILSTKSPESLE